MAKAQQSATEVFDLLVEGLRAKNWNFDDSREKLLIKSSYQGEDIPIDFIINVDEKRECVRFIASVYHMAEDKRVEGALAVCVANYGMVNGSFDYDINDGEIRFRLTTSYCGCIITKDFVMDMITTALLSADRYNDKFLMLSKGAITLEEFIKQENE